LKKLNKILIVFFAFTFLTIYGGWRFIHSSKFSEQASKKVSKILTKKFGAKLAFSGVDFNIFPPSTIFKDVHIEKSDPQLADINLDIEELRFAFTYASFFSSELEIDDLTLKNGKISIKTHKNDSPDIKWRELNTKKLFEQYSELIAKSPLLLNMAHFENIKLKIDQSQALVKTFVFAPHRRNIRLKLMATDVHVVANKDEFPAINGDKISALLDLSKDEWKIDSFLVEMGLNKIELQSSIFNNEKNLQNVSSVTFDINTEKVLEPFLPFMAMIKLPPEVKRIKGSVLGVVETRGELFDPEVKATLEVRKFKSDWIEVQKAKIVLKKKKNVLILDQFLANNGSEIYDLLKPIVFFDLQKKSLIHLKAALQVTNAFTNTFLFAIKNTMDSLKGYVTGKIDVVWDGEKVFFMIHQKAQVQAFKLMAQTSGKVILQNDGFELEETTFSLDKFYKLSLDAKLIMNNSKVLATGEITGKDLNITIKDSKIDMLAFGKIAGLKLTGSGPTSVEIYGPFNDVKFDFNVDWNDFSIVDLNFGKVKSEFSLSLKDLEINIHELKGVYNQSFFTANGLLNFGSKSGMDLSLDFSNTNFTDARKMYQLVFKNIKLPVIPEFNFSTSYKIKGGYSVDSLDITGVVKGTDLKVFNEEAERLSLDFSLKNSLLSFNNIKIIKSRGEINSNVSINLGNNYTELEGRVLGLRLNDFNFYKKLKLEYDGDVDIDFDGNGIKENFSSRFKTKIANAFIENIPASPSNAIIYLNTDEVLINANLLSGKMKLDSAINFKTRMISLKSNIETNDMREVLGIVAGHNMAEKNISGKIKSKLDTMFNIDNFEIKKFFLNIAQFNLKKNDVNVLVDPQHNSVLIEEGIIKNWDLKFIDGNDFFISKARNSTGTAIIFDQSFSIKTSILEFFTNSIDKTFGVIKGASQVVVDKKIAITSFSLNGSKNSMKIKNLPGAITNLDYSIVKKGNVFEIAQFSGKYGEGEMKASGSLIFDNLFPKINIEYKIERSNIPLFKRSTLLASSSGTISGSEFPYKLNGKISLLHGEFLDDPADFTKSNKVTIDNFKKYLPQKSDAGKKGYLNLNMTLETVGQIAIKNNLAEVYVKGSGQIYGDVFNPEMTVRIETLPTISKFKFKGNDFILSQGSVDIRDRGKIRTSELKFIGLSRISDFDVTLDISGSIPKPVITLTSEPNLAQEDLLSLLTLGVTSDMSKNLGSGERKSVMTVSLGTLLVEQFKINEDLNSTLGVKLSVQPEFKEDETSLVQGKSATIDNGGSKLKSATKFKINKQINKSVDVSVSSTVGGSIEQTQEMNINYNYNRHFSLEGIYEVKPSEENTNTPNSLGADLKYKWSF
jgi:translocation and assembly module TamB